MYILCHSVVLTNASSVSGFDNNVLFCQVCTASLFKLTFIHLLDEIQCALPYTVTLCVFWHVVSASRLQSSGCCKCLILLNIIIKQHRRQWRHELCRALVDVSWHSLTLTLLHSHSLTFPRTDSLTFSDTLTLSHSFSLSHVLQHSHSLTHWHLFSLSHSLTYTLFLTLTLSLSHALIHTLVPQCLRVVEAVGLHW